MTYSAMEELELKAQIRDRAEEKLRLAIKIDGIQIEIAQNTMAYWVSQSSLAD